MTQPSLANKPVKSKSLRLLGSRYAIPKMIDCSPSEVLKESERYARHIAHCNAEMEEMEDIDCSDIPF